MDERLLDFWRQLDFFEIKYIMVGGVAVNLHGYSRTTEDIDILIKDTSANRKQLGGGFAIHFWQDRFLYWDRREA